MLKKQSPFTLLFTLVVLGGLLTGCTSGSSSSEDHSQSATNSVQTSSTKPSASHKAILSKLITYTNQQSAGPTKNYYWENGRAKLSGFQNMKAGDTHFSADSQGRSTTAKAILTYSEYRASQGSRQGTPLAPPAWPSQNPKVAITYGLTGRTYHGYLYNRSHSIADSLLGAKSYTSEYNFTTGTRPQNVGANQDGGMRHAEELAENYWQNHANTKNTISYETTPLYQADETIPRGSVVDIKSSDGRLDQEIVVLNSVEGYQINYTNGSNSSSTVANQSRTTESSSQSSSSTAESSSTSSVSQSTETPVKPTTNGQWTIAGSGMVYVSDSNKYYSKVMNPNNYEYMSQTAAVSNGATQAIRGNQYAQP
ncbi:DNA/RNA non-specific endonuclease [Levilactobacillus bambusae]|uniref:Deoxyribonuclease n=1 Tax=Levilactobacillus bambusae TaxID=2024736 RepID=A0A2V1MWT8_9LACO|nr:DNA/RNA non-specific endonuclease [Levilactobacillus bambusae]PWF99498.1 deoxyribonuclease [Levilactobacillus bambusae]